jgi:hypothetical protein
MAVADTEQAGIVRFDVRIQFGFRVKDQINILSALFVFGAINKDVLGATNKGQTRDPLPDVAHARLSALNA